MAFATGSTSYLAYVMEPGVTWGDTPGTPALKALPVKSWDISNAKDGFQSGDIRADRQVQDYRHAGNSPTGKIGFELKHGDYDDILEMALFGTFTANELKGGTVRNAATFEGGHSDISVFRKSAGMMVNSLSMSLGTDGAVECSAEMLGKDFAIGVSSIDGDGITAVSGNRSFDVFTGTIDEGGASIATVTKLDLSIANNIELAKVIGSADPTAAVEGRQVVTGSISAYFESGVLLAKFVNENNSSLEFVLTDPDANTMTVTLPNVVYTGAEAPVDSEGGIQLNMPFQAVYDVTDDTSIKIARSA